MKLLTHARVTSTCALSSRCVFFFVVEEEITSEFFLDKDFSFDKSASELVTLQNMNMKWINQCIRTYFVVYYGPYEKLLNSRREQRRRVLLQNMCSLFPPWKVSVFFMSHFGHKFWDKETGVAAPHQIIFCSPSNLTCTWKSRFVCLCLTYFSLSVFCLSQFVVIASTVTSAGLRYDEYVFPNWTNVVGWGVAMSSMLFVPFYAIYKFFSVPGTFKEVSIRTGWTRSFKLFEDSRYILWL